MTATDSSLGHLRVRSVVGAFAILIFASGCTSFEIARVRNDIARDVPSVDVGDGFSVSLGRGSLGLARLAISGASDGSESDDAIRQALRLVKKVEIGRYPFVPQGESLDVASLPSLSRYQRNDWTRVLSVRGDSDVAFVFVREDGFELKQALVVSFADEMLTLVKLSGNLETALGMILKSVDNPLKSRAQTGEQPSPATSSG